MGSAQSNVLEDSKLDKYEIEEDSNGFILFKEKNPIYQNFEEINEDINQCNYDLISSIMSNSIESLCSDYDESGSLDEKDENYENFLNKFNNSLLELSLEPCNLDKIEEKLSIISNYDENKIQNFQDAKFTDHKKIEEKSTDLKKIEENSTELNNLDACLIEDNSDKLNFSEPNGENLDLKKTEESDKNSSDSENIQKFGISESEFLNGRPEWLLYDTKRRKNVQINSDYDCIYYKIEKGDLLVIKRSVLPSGAVFVGYYDDSEVYTQISWIEKFKKEIQDNKPKIQKSWIEIYNLPTYAQITAKSKKDTNIQPKLEISTNSKKIDEISKINDISIKFDGEGRLILIENNTVKACTNLPMTAPLLRRIVRHVQRHQKRLLKKMDKIC